MAAKRIRVDELWTLMRYGGDKFFSVTFETRTPKFETQIIGGLPVRVMIRPPGVDRKMICRTGMHKYKLGVIPDLQRDEEDFRNAVITCWSLDAYWTNRKAGMAAPAAGWEAWRRIDVITVKSLSLMDVGDLPPDIIAGVHDLSNNFRLANLPRAPIPA